MKIDEFAFFNQQLATMLTEGIPLEGALKQLSANMQGKQLRTELELLETDLKNGTPLKTALTARKLPDFYKHMVGIGIASNNLPGVLLMLADYYKLVDATWTRLKGLMVYPLIVLLTSFALSCFLTFAGSRFFIPSFQSGFGVAIPSLLVVNLWVPPIIIGLLLMVSFVVFLVPIFQRKLRWRIPAFKEARLAQIAAGMGMMLKGGGNLSESLSLIQAMEAGTVASGELAQWNNQLKHGHGTFSEMAAPGKAFPPLFLWLVTNAGEDLAGGFNRAAEIYSERARHRIEMFLYAALPFSILAIGTMIGMQVFPFMRMFIMLMNGI